jgi:hypothetical protein
MSVNIKQIGWKDLVSDIHARGSGANDPTWSQIGATGFWAHSFSASTMMQVWTTFHIPHDYAPGTNIYLHTHWVQSGTNTGNCVWGFEYAYAKGYDQAAFPFAASTTVRVTAAGSSTPYLHHISEISLANSIPSTNIETDGLIHVRVFRDATNGADTLTDSVYLLMADCHYQSSHETTPNKNYPFY